MTAESRVSIAGGRADDVAPLENVSSIAKAARVLRVVASMSSGECGVTRVALAAGLPKSTTHRVLAELAAEGLVIRTEARYRLGPAWFGLQGALSSPEWVQLVERARSPLARLFETTGATVHLGVLVGGDVLYLEKLTALGGTLVPTRVGSMMPANCTAVGKVLLAHSSPDAVRALITRPLQIRTGASIATPGRLLSQLEAIRRSGVGYDLEESQPGVYCVAAPVFDNGRAVAAVSVTRTRARALMPTDEARTRAAATQIGSWLVETA